MYGSAAKDYLKALLTSHLEQTGSERAATALRDLDEFIRRLWVVVPASEKGNPLLAAQVLYVCMLVYVCMYGCMYVYMYTCMYVNMQTMRSFLYCVK